MTLHSGLDTVAIASHGVFTKTYGSTTPGNIANLYASFGLLEDASQITMPENTPTARTFIVQAENRTFFIPYEPRAFKVQPEKRTLKS